MSAMSMSAPYCIVDRRHVSVQHGSKFEVRPLLDPSVRRAPVPDPDDRTPLNRTIRQMNRGCLGTSRMRRFPSTSARRTLISAPRARIKRGRTVRSVLPRIRDVGIQIEPTLGLDARGKPAAGFDRFAAYPLTAAAGTAPICGQEVALTRIEVCAHFRCKHNCFGPLLAGN